MTRLQEQLTRICAELGIEIQLDQPFTFSDGSREIFEMLIPHFGGRRGTLATSISAKIKNGEDIVAAGYGYSCLSEPTNNSGYTVDGCINMFSEWGWSGAGTSPQWLLPEEAVNGQEE